MRPASFYNEGEFAMTDTMWKCEQLRAGMVYNRVMFNTRAEAEQFAEQITQENRTRRRSETLKIRKKGK